MNITPNDFKKGISIIYKNQIWQIVDFYRQRTGMRKAYVVTKLKNFNTGQVVEETWGSNETVESAYVETTQMQYLYRDGKNLVLMDPVSFEQPTVPLEMAEDIMDLIKEGMNLSVTQHDGKIIGIMPPDFVELEVTDAPPHVKGDTATAEYRDVICEGGAKVKAPPFVKTGDTIKIDTRTREYVERVKK